VAKQSCGDGQEDGLTQDVELRATGPSAFRKAMQQQRKLPGLRLGGQAAEVDTVGCDSEFSHLTRSLGRRMTRTGRPQAGRPRPKPRSTRSSSSRLTARSTHSDVLYATRPTGAET